MLRRGFCVLNNNVRGLLTRHVDIGDDEIAWDLWEDRGVNDAQAVYATHAKAAIQNRVLVAFGSHATRATGVVTPCLPANPILYRLFVSLGHLFESGIEFALNRAAPFADISNELHTIDKRGQVEIVVAAIWSGDFMEGVEINLRCVERINAPKLHRPIMVGSVTFEDCPGKETAKQPVWEVLVYVGVADSVAFERQWYTEDE
jgi:hypothetical protein